MSRRQSRNEAAVSDEMMAYQRDEKVLRYVIHRIDEDGDLHGVLEESYVRRHCSQEEIDEMIRNPELVHASREHMERVFGSGELDLQRKTPVRGKR